MRPRIAVQKEWFRQNFILCNTLFRRHYFLRPNGPETTFLYIETFLYKETYLKEKRMSMVFKKKVKKNYLPAAQHSPGNTVKGRRR